MPLKANSKQALDCLLHHIVAIYVSNSLHFVKLKSSVNHCQPCYGVSARTCFINKTKFPSTISGHKFLNLLLAFRAVRLQQEPRD